MKRTALLALTLAVVALAGCERAPTALRLGYSPTLAHAAALVGVQSGRYSRAGGLPVRASVYPAGPAAIEALLFRDIDIAYVGPVPAVAAFSRSQGRFVIVAGAASGGAALVASKQSGITTTSGLRNAKVATPQLGNTQDVAARFYFGELGFTTYEHGGNFKIMPTGNPELVASLAKGYVSAAWTVEPWATMLIQETGATMLLDEADLWKLKSSTGTYPTAVVVVRAALLKRHPKVVDDFLRLHAEETAWINAHPEEAQRLAEAALSKLTRRAFAPGVMAKAWRRVHFSTEVLRDAIEIDADRAFRVGFTSGEELEMDKLVDESSLKRATSGLPRS